jgi:hypothetical protein
MENLEQKHDQPGRWETKIRASNKIRGTKRKYNPSMERPYLNQQSASSPQPPSESCCRKGKNMRTSNLSQKSN